MFLYIKIKKLHAARAAIIKIAKEIDGSFI